jgi:hypothetical protein
MKLYYFKKDFLDLLKLDNDNKYDHLTIINKMLELKLIKKFKVGSTNIPSRRIKIPEDFRNSLNIISKKVNPKLKILYKKKCTLSLLYNFLWRFTLIENYRKEIPNKLSITDFKFVKTLTI